MPEAHAGAVAVTRLHLIDAARRGQLTTIREILDRHPTLINWVDEAGGRWGFRGRTALWAAVDRPRDSAEVVELLLERGASVDAHNAELNCWYAPEAGSPAVDSATLLHLAAGKGDAATVRLLVEHGMSVLATDERGHGPLHAVESGDAEAEKVEILLELGADPNQKTADGVTPLDVVRDDKSVAALLAAGANPDSGKDGTWPLKEAIRQGRVDVARRLIEAGADRDRRDSRGHSLLQIAAYVCQADSIRLLLEVGLSADGDKGPLSPLNRSLQRGHVEGVELLIKAGAEVAADALHGVTWLQGEASIRCAELLVSAGADPNAVEGPTQSTPLHSAASAGEVSAIDFLLLQGAKVDAQNTDGGTPLLEACNASKPEAVDRLLEAGANPLAKARDGRTPWSVTKVSGAGRDIKRLLEKYIPKKPKKAAAPEATPEWAEGDSVLHVKFGPGVITETTGRGDQLKATVDFESAGTKQLLARFLKRP